MNAIKGYLTGRSNRREFWISMVLLVLASGSAGALGHAILGNAIGFFLWLPIAIRRLRAVGWSPWLSLAPLGGSFGFGVLMGMVRTIVPVMTVDTAKLLSVAVGVVATWAFIICLGARPSRKEAARLDEAPRLAEVFD
ncbi:hypothetical protein DDF62_02765 [Caulobacter radicis]|uniref:DUF805 domain-containing protein n=1 Tax=Caulobacter radicis TaxID=2172650 RepID=UPI000D58884D|nr:DUF805 domain-containing protein [Caulobacter radicis]PVM92093.1 hypothetical protein DDF62_02765 [Caulobacter radicis]